MKFRFCLILIFLSTLALAQHLKVGVYQNPPLLSVDSVSGPDGFTMELLKVIAAKNNWTLEYKTYEFAACLEALREGKIDLMPALAFSAERDSIYLLNTTNVTSNWAKIYKHDDDNTQYNSFEDLRNRRIAVLKGDFYVQNGEDGLLDVFDELDISSELAYFNSYEEVVRAIEDEIVDIGLLSRYYGLFQTADNNIVKTPINLAYVSLRYGMHRTPGNQPILDVLDQELQRLINNRSSVYYELERQHLAFKGSSFIPGWLWQTFLVVLIGLTTLAVFTILLQYQVKRKTGELKETNRLLVRSEHEARLAATTIEASQDIGYWFVPGQPFIKVNKAACQLTGYSKEELLQMVPRELFASDRNAAVYEKIRQGDWEGHLLIEEEFRRKDGSIFPVEISLDEFELDGNKYICGFARNITERVRAENELLEKNKELSCLYAINQLTANRELKPDEIFTRALKLIPIAWQYPELTVVKIIVHDKAFTSKNFVETPWQLKADILEGKEQAGELIVGYLKQPEGLKDPFLVEENNLISALGKEFSDMLTTRDTERRIMATILTTEDKERSRISKELHDSVGQTLSAISLHLNAMAKLEALSEEDRKKLVEIENLVKEAIGESRSVSHNLMPPALTDLGLAYAVENILESIAGLGQTKFAFHTNSQETDVPKELEFALFRIVQEAINNIIKYARASEATIQYLVFAEDVSLSIEDNGVGFDMQIAEKKHNFGLNSMRNRAMSLGGTIEINSSPGQGTSIIVQVPLK